MRRSFEYVLSASPALFAMTSVTASTLNIRASFGYRSRRDEAPHPLHRMLLVESNQSTGIEDDPRKLSVTAGPPLSTHRESPR